MLLVYLAGSSVSVLVNTLVEKEQLASEVYYQTETRPNKLIWFEAAAVATEKLDEVRQRLIEVLRETASKPLDMSYLLDTIRREKRQILVAAETSQSMWSTGVIEDHLYGDRKGQNLRDSLQSLSNFEELEKWTDKQWRDFMKKYFCDAHYVSILGKPSKKLNEKLKAEEKARVKAQQEHYGEEGLKRLAKQLEDAKAENDKELPKGLLEGFKIPGVESIHFISTTTARAGSAKDMGRLQNSVQEIVDSDKSDSPFFLHFESIPSNFVRIHLLINTSSVPKELMPLVAVYLENFFKTPVVRNGCELDFEAVIQQLEKDTSSYQITAAYHLDQPDCLNIRMTVEREKYSTAISWIQDLLINSKFDKERLKSTLTKMIAEIPDAKRSGSTMLSEVDKMIHLDQTSSSHAQNTLVQAVYLKRIKKMLEADPDAVIARMEEIRKALYRFSNFRAFIIADVEKLPKPVSSWDTFTSGLDSGEKLHPLPDRKQKLTDGARNPGSLNYIVPIASIDSSFAKFTAKGIDSMHHPQLPALMVAYAYLDAVEGPMWVAVRGTGLAYGVNHGRNCGTGLAYFNIYRSPDPFKAFTAARSVIEDYLSGKRQFETPALEGAISSIVMDFASQQQSPPQAAIHAIANIMTWGISKDWQQEMLKKVRQIGVEEIKAVMNDMILPIFTPGKSNMVITCATIMQEVSGSAEIYNRTY